MGSEPSGAAHEQDSILFCGSSSSGPVDGSVRLLSPDGLARLSATGIVEIFLNNRWSPVCGISSGAESLLCKTLGFAGAAAGSQHGGTARSSSAPLVGDLACSGFEESVLNCSFNAGDDVY